MSVIADPRALEQRRLAAARSWQVRSARAEARREIRGLGYQAGKARVGELLLECPDWLVTEPVHLMLLWPPRMPRELAYKTLAAADVHGVKPVGELTLRQSLLIAARLGHPVAEAER